MGDQCSCMYFVDETMYAATVQALGEHPRYGPTVTVRFDGWGNIQEDTPLAYLQPVAHSQHQQHASITTAAGYQHHAAPEHATPEPYYGRSGGVRPAPAQSPPTRHPSTPAGPGGWPPSSGSEATPQRPAVLSGVDESLASMLMAWYQTGFQTGYYMAQQQQHPPPT